MREQVPDYHRDEREALDATDRKENQRLYGQDETPIPTTGQPQTLGDLIRGDFKNIWIAAERKNR